MGQSVTLAYRQDVLVLALSPASSGAGFAHSPTMSHSFGVTPGPGQECCPAQLVYSSLDFAGGLLQLHIWAVVVSLPASGGAW